MAVITYGGGGTVSIQGETKYTIATYTGGDPIDSSYFGQYITVNSTFELQAPGVGNEGNVLVIRNENTSAVTFTLASGVTVLTGVTIPPRSTCMLVARSDTSYDATGTV